MLLTNALKFGSYEYLTDAGSLDRSQVEAFTEVAGKEFTDQIQKHLDDHIKAQTDVFDLLPLDLHFRLAEMIDDAFPDASISARTILWTLLVGKFNSLADTYLFTQRSLKHVKSAIDNYKKTKLN